MSLAEVMRRAGEYFLALYPEGDRSVAHWEPPQPVDLCMIIAPESEWRTLANEPTHDEQPEEAG
jgi:hypothetical protein